MKYLLLISIFMLSSCAITTNYSLNKLQYGQSKNDVIKAIGSPTSKRILGESNEVYIYYVHDSLFDLFLTARFPFIGFYPINRTGKEILLYFNDNKLVKSIGAKEHFIK